MSHRTAHGAGPRDPGPGAPLGLPLTALLLAGCQGPQSMLEPSGPGAASIASMWWVLLVVMTAVFLAVMGALGYALLHARRADEDDREPAERRRVGAVLVAGAGVPALILAGIFVYTLTILDEIGPSVTDDDATTITVIGKQFWWDIRYALPDGDTVVTANELHIPVGERVTLLLESDNVIHSVWIPSLHGKTDMIPGRTNRMWLTADEPGVYRGQCAEYCGRQHTWMVMLVVAQPEAEFRAWLARQRRPAAPTPPGPPGPPAPDSAIAGDDARAADLAAADSAADEPAPPVPDSLRRAALARNARIRRGREVFLEPANRCVECHTIRGVSERGGPGSGGEGAGPGPRRGAGAAGSPAAIPMDGPDLTHVASRRTLAGGLLPMSRGSMAGWIANPQVLKPGNLMPRVPLEPDDLNALLEYLMSLR